jgi:hypothetical protein
MNKNNKKKLALHRETLKSVVGGIDKLCTGLRSTCIGNSAVSCNYTECCVVQVSIDAPC